MPFFCKCLIKSCYGPKIFFCEVVSFSRCRNYLERVDQIKNWLMIQQLQLFQCLQLVFRDLRLSWSLKGEKSLLTFHWKCWPEKKTRKSTNYMYWTNRTLEYFALESKSRRGSRGSYEFLSVRLSKTWQINLNNYFYNSVKFHRLWSKFRYNYSKIKSAKMPQNMKSSDSFRTVFYSAVLCQLIPLCFRQKKLFNSPPHSSMMEQRIVGLFKSGPCINNDRIEASCSKVFLTFIPSI